MDRLPLIRNKQKTIGILDIVLAVLYLGVIALLIVAMVGAMNINTDTDGDGQTSGGEAIGGIVAAFAGAILVVFLILIAIIVFIGFIFWLVSGALQLSASTGKKDVNRGFNTFVGVIQIISFIIVVIYGLISLSGLKKGASASDVLTPIIFIGASALCLVSAIFKFKLNGLMRAGEQKEEIEEMQHTAEHRADKNVFEDETDE